MVETVGLSDARFYAKRVKQWELEWLDHSKVAEIDEWGSPMRCRRVLLGTSKAYSPTTLRYLAAALWLMRSGKLQNGNKIIEIGVGFGGLVAMNKLVSEATSILVDLPQVEIAAKRMLTEIGQDSCLQASGTDIATSVALVISNYAFTELNKGLQDAYLERYLKSANHGMIMSNAGVFAKMIGGLTDDELVAWLRDSGISASIESEFDLLSPIDALCGVRLIHW